MQPPRKPPAFVPVPSASTRHDGWTPERQRDFIAQLARIGLVSAAAKAVGMSAKSAYRLRDRAHRAEDKGESFLKAWDAAIGSGRVSAISTAIDRAIEGVEVPYFHGGLQRATWRRYDNRLLYAVLQLMKREHGAARVAGVPSDRSARRKSRDV